MCETDDIIVVLEKSGLIRKWFFKQNRKKLNAGMRACVDQLEAMEPVDRGPYTQQCQVTETDNLPALIGLIRFYLG